MMNRCVLVGRLTKNPDLRYTPAGVPVATFTLAVNRSFTNQQGEKEADFINVVVWRKPAENVAQYLKKGSLAGVDGRVQTRNYEHEGRRIYVTEVLAESVQFLEPKKTSSYQPPMEPPQERNIHQGQRSHNEDPFANNGSIDIPDDELPF